MKLNSFLIKDTEIISDKGFVGSEYFCKDLKISINFIEILYATQKLRVGHREDTDGQLIYHTIINLSLVHLLVVPYLVLPLVLALIAHLVLVIPLVICSPPPRSFR